MSDAESSGQSSDVAIIGMAGRFPGAPSIEQFWKNLREGLESISFFSDDELEISPGSRGKLSDPNYVKAGAPLDDVELFDASFFGYNPGEARILDPQQRIFLECAWHALENAGYDAEKHDGSIGVFAGMTISTYLLLLLSTSNQLATLNNLQLVINNDKDHLATRTSYKLNLKGPSVSVQTACSTSLVATHLACQSLLNGECDVALAGGVSVHLPQKEGYFFQEGGIASPDGHCRAFDDKAQGTIGGNGVGVVVLKPLARALEDGDSVLAVIKGSAINNDGSLKVGYTAPSVDGQVSVIAEALGLSGVDPETITYIEAHGTGTTLGDPIEMAALTQAFRASTDKRGFCAIGSVKTNIGHLDAAAGVAGLIKTVLALEHKQIPASLNYEEPNKKIDFEASPFYVNTRLREWETNGKPRRAGVSSFGMGGTNAHVILEEAPEREQAGEARPWQLLTLSAMTETALEAATTNLVDHLNQHPGLKIADVAYTLNRGRRDLSHRRIVVCSDTSDALSGLRERAVTGHCETENRPVTFMCSGQGSQYIRMAQELFETEEIFREQIKLCSGLIEHCLGEDLIELLYPIGARAEGAAEKLNQTQFTQPVLFAVEYALARLWIEWGVAPSAMIGHSVGEYVVACLAGVLSLDQALTLIATRGKLMQGLPAGAMLSVPLSERELRPFLRADVSVAAINGPSRCVISGSPEAVAQARTALGAKGIAYKQLHTSHAFHSEMMEPILNRFSEHVKRVKLKAPKIPYISNLTGTWIKESEATDPDYWVTHLRETVRFADGLHELLKEQDRIFLEIGPGSTLTTLTRQHPERSARQLVLSSLPNQRPEQSDVAFTLNSLGQLWLAGIKVNWPAFYAGQRRQRIALPAYPFERKRYWIEGAVIGAPASTKRGNAVASGEAHSNIREAGEKEIVMVQPRTSAQSVSSRSNRILSELSDIISQLVGVSLEELSAQKTFIEMGVDSLLLIQAIQSIQNRMKVKLSLVQLLEEFTTIEALARHLDDVLPQEALRDGQSDGGAPRKPENETSPIHYDEAQTERRSIQDVSQASMVGRLVAQQLEIMSQQLSLLRDHGMSPSTPLSVEAPRAIPASIHSEAYVPYQPLQVGSKGRLNQRQRRHLNDLIARHTARTRESKRITQVYRKSLADNRSSTGFRLLWKEMMYPIIGNRSRGSRVWDVDGNEYIDATMGFGIYLFGHSPDFIIDAIDDQLRQGLQVGPQSDLAGEVAALICELAGVERVTFCNSGTEAVMTALRIARAVTGRNKVVIFAGYYHGSFDGTLARPIVVDGKPRATPLAPGVMPGMIDDLLVLDYDSPESLEIIKEHAGELAAILIEPVQSRQPHVQPKRFLHELRRLTEETQTALIFDEVITGFRIHPGGAQEWFGVRADLVTYGKIVGGGMPIGVVAGSAAYMDAIDGGAWNFGDDSYPSQQKTFFAGTFCKHPLTMAAARAALSHMKARGPSLQQELNERTSRFAETLNNYFEQDQTPIRIANFGSLFRFIFSKEVKFSDLFFYYLQDKGVYIWEGNTCFLSTAHNDAEIAQVIEAIKECVAEMRAGDFLPSAPARREQKELCAVPLTEAQKQLWILAQMGDDASRAYNESLSLSLRGQLQLTEMRNAIQQLIARHEALRISIGPDGEYQYIHPEITIAVPLDDFSNLADAERESLLAEWLRNEAERNFDFLNGPLVRARIAKLEEQRFILAITIHHIVIDGWSVGILLGELKELYSAGVGSVPIKLGSQARFGDYVRRQEELQGGREMAEAQSYWLGQFSDSVPVLDLPADAPRPPALTYNGSRVRYEIAPETYRGLQRISSQQGCTLFMTMLAGFQTLLHYVTRQSDIVVGIHTAGQLTSNSENLVGYCLNVLPIRSRPAESATFAEHLASVKKKTLEAFEHQAYPFITLVRELNIPRDPARAPLISVVFNLDRAAAGLRFGDLQVDVSSNSSIFARYELFWNMVETDSQIIVECDYNIDLFAAETIRDWLGMYEAILRVVTDKPDIALTEMKEMLAEQERQRRDLQAEAFKQTRQQKLKGVRRKVIAQQR